MNQFILLYMFLNYLIEFTLTIFFESVCFITLDVTFLFFYFAHFSLCICLLLFLLEMNEHLLVLFSFDNKKWLQVLELFLHNLNL